MTTSVVSKRKIVQLQYLQNTFLKTILNAFQIAVGMSSCTLCDSHAGLIEVDNSRQMPMYQFTPHLTPSHFKVMLKM